ncbi:MAG: hypothetical protein R3280_07310 [Marinobacter sp.]|uniref:tetratricopeptide repeat protein n=1 Tax=Marinobacter sp. TaxID=50741 RepID=UPI00299DB018|nr:hypothetical protein [Marinobacter sp.]MDX1634425.1 hypothetical protein [Marinobacter sp.]
MARLRLAQILAGLLCASALPQVLADNAVTTPEASPRTLMAEGVSAFQAGELERARLLLEQARDAGLKSSSLHYNLGVVYYRLSLYDQAREAFAALLGTPHADLARYNLGLVAKAAGRPAEAQTWFQAVAEEAEQDKLRRLALAQLNQPEPVTAGPWLGFAALGGGYEDNLSLLPETAATDLSDGFGELILVAQGPLLTLDADTDSAESIDLSASFYRRQYTSEDDFNNDALQLGVGWTSERRDGQHQLRLRQSYFRIGDESREYHTTLEGSARQYGCWLQTGNGRCDLALAVSRITPFTGFEPYEGMRYLASAGYRVRLQQWQPRVQLRLEHNDRDDLASNGQFVSVSPRRQELEAGLTYLGLPRLSLGAELAYRYSDYPDAYILSPSPERKSGRRVDHRYLAGLEANLRLSAAWSVTAEASYRKNESSLKQYAYDNHVALVSLDLQF